ncbi:hypothetical protein AAFF_G00118360 [Aldrovandia affinis]|uniref:Uncharacterized protein n=1 Tax=Aldrovandia affinis TaxID=143900 RepID=A0AAD7RSJ0_9TELE|nr:hypothetical protein AAFF_G00118360 [Aldrovandia affinis]
MPNKADRTLTIKKNACRIIQTSLHSECIEDRNVTLSWFLPCFTRTPRGRTVQAKSSSAYMHEENVEGLPLKKTCMSDVQWAEKGLEPECRVSVEDGNAE